MTATLLSALPSLASLAAVLGLALLAARLYRASPIARPAGAARLALRESLILDRTRRLLLIRCDERELVLLTGTGRDVVVGWLDRPAPVPSPSSPAPSHAGAR